MTLGLFIKKYREDNNLTMDEFSQKSGLSKSYISMLERNKDPRGNPIHPRIEAIEKVANCIGYDVNDLIASLDDDIMINNTQKTELTEFVTRDEEAYKKWNFIKYCYDHASETDKNRVLSILKVKEKWTEFKEIESILLEDSLKKEIS